MADSADGRRAAVPAWLVSVLLHASLFVALGVTLELTPEGSAEELLRDVGIVLKKTDAETGEPEYDGEDEVLTQDSGQSATEALDEAIADGPPSDLTSALPTEEDWLGSAQTESGSLDAGNLVGDSTLQRTPRKGSTTTQVFGVTGEGSKFVYVFDRSGSMERSLGPSPLKAAKMQLLASLQSLEANHQFQIIFYNQEPFMFIPRGQGDNLVFADERMKLEAEQFLNEIAAVGATTGREAALLKALQLQPDVVFFLSDVDNPLTPRQLKKIRDRNKGRTSINTIEFDRGLPKGGSNFLKDLAKDNGGSYIYVDISKLDSYYDTTAK